MDYEHANEILDSDSIIRLVSMYYNKNDYEAFCVFINKIADPKIILGVGELVSGKINTELLDKFLSDENISDITKFGLFYGLEGYLLGLKEDNKPNTKYVLRILYQIKEINGEIMNILKTNQIFQMMKLYGSDFENCLLDKLSKDKFNELLDFILGMWEIMNDMLMGIEVARFLVSVYFKHSYFDDKYVFSIIGCLHSCLNTRSLMYNRNIFWSNDLVEFLFFCINNMGNRMDSFIFIQLIKCYIKDSFDTKDLSKIDVPINFLLRVYSETNKIEYHGSERVIKISGTMIREIIKKKYIFSIDRKLLETVYKNSNKFTQEEIQFIGSLPIKN